jgi:protein phosphatase
MGDWKNEEDRIKKRFDTEFYSQPIERIIQDRDRIKHKYPDETQYKQCVERLIEILQEDKILLKNITAKGSEVLICGDTHGYIEGTCTVLEEFITKSKTDPNVSLVFLGDYIDRGDYQIQNVYLIAKARLEYSNIYFIRGNHDFKAVNKMYGFIDEIYKIYTRKEYWILTNKLFNQFYTAVTINNSILCIHAGIPVNPPLMFLTLDQMFRAFRKGRINEFTDNIIEGFSDSIDFMEENEIDWQHFQCFWNDPISREFNFHEPIFNLNEDRESIRGPGTYKFSEKTLDQFMAAFKVSMLIRAHEAYPEGFAKLYNGKVWSVFSILDYGNQRIKGKYLLLKFKSDANLDSIAPHSIH